MAQVEDRERFPRVYEFAAASAKLDVAPTRLIAQTCNQSIFKPGLRFLATFSDDERLRALKQKAAMLKGFKILPVVVKVVTKTQIQLEDFSCDVEVL